MRAYGRTLFELIYHNTPIYAVDRQPLFCTFCARAQNVSKQSCHLGPSGPNDKIREKILKLSYLGTGFIRQGGLGVPDTFLPNTAPTMVSGRIIKRQIEAIAS